MALIRYADVSAGSDTWPFVDDENVLSAYSKLKAFCGPVLQRDTVKSDPTSGSRTLYFKSNAYNYLSVAMEPVPVFNEDGSRGETSAQKDIAFASTDARDFGYLILAGRLGFAWWAMNGDDFNVTSGVLASFPASFAGCPSPFREQFLRWAPALAEAQADATVWKLNLGKRIGNWNLAACRHVSDRSDLEILEASACTIHEIEAIWTFYHRIYMSGSE